METNLTLLHELTDGLDWQSQSHQSRIDELRQDQEYYERYGRGTSGDAWTIAAFAGSVTAFVAADALFVRTAQ
jgi:hypothetical protein